MPNPRLEPGTWGDIRTYRRGKKWMAVCQFCDQTGTVTQRSKTATSEAAAIRELKNTLTKATQTEAGGSTITGRTRLRHVAQEMLLEKRTHVTTGRLSAGTLRNYEAHYRLYVEPALGNLAVEWLGVQRCDRFLKTLRQSKGYATVKGVRSVLSEILAFAERNEAIPTNPVERCADIPGDGHKRVKALTAAEAVRIHHLLQKLALEPAQPVNGRQYRAVRCPQLVPDLWLWMLGTGDRISNALAVLWESIDLDNGTARLGANVVRVPGRGLQRKEGGSKSAVVEGVDLPEQVTAMLMLRQRREDYYPDGPVFAGVNGCLLDPSNVGSKKLRPALKAIGYGHVSSHWCRRTLGSELNAAGLSIMDIAGRLRHSDSRVTERSYIEKRGGNERVRLAIEAMLAVDPGQRD